MLMSQGDIASSYNAFFNRRKDDLEYQDRFYLFSPDKTWDSAQLVKDLWDDELSGVGCDTSMKGEALEADQSVQMQKSDLAVKRRCIALFKKTPQKNHASRSGSVLPASYNLIHFLFIYFSLQAGSNGHYSQILPEGDGGVRSLCGF